MRICLIAALFLLVGCTSPVVSEETLGWYNARTQLWVDSVKSSCLSTHSRFLSGRSLVDCHYSRNAALSMTFPNRNLYVRNQSEVSEYLYNWCASIGSRFGDLPFYVIIFRDTGRRHGFPCRYLLQEDDDIDHPR